MMKFGGIGLKVKSWVATLLIVAGALTSTALVFAEDQIKLLVNGKNLTGEVPPQIINGVTMVPIRMISEALGAEVYWDRRSLTVHIDTGKVHISKEQVKAWISEQGKDKAEHYFFDGLSFETANLDADDEIEVVAKIDGAVHLGQFFIFDKQPNGDYRLIEETDEKIEEWKLENPIDIDGKKLFEFVSRTGGTGVDVYEAHLWYLDHGKFVEAWKGTLEDRSSFQEIFSLTVGGFRVNAENKRLYAWKSSSKYQEGGEQEIMVESVKTVSTTYQFDGIRFVAEA